MLSLTDDEEDVLLDNISCNEPPDYLEINNIATYNTNTQPQHYENIHEVTASNNDLSNNDLSNNDLSNDNSSDDTILPDYESIDDDDELINHIYYDNHNNSLRISLLRIENNIKNINSFSYYLIIINLLLYCFALGNFYIYNPNNIYNFTSYNDINNNEELNKQYNEYNQKMIIYLSLTMVGLILQCFNFYKLKPNVFSNENRNYYYGKKKMYNFLEVYNQLIALLTIILISKNHKIEIENYLEILTLIILICNYIAFKILAIFMNINIYLNLH